MSKTTGFRWADVSVSLFDDPKIRRLWRQCQGDVAAMNEATVLFLAVILASWRDSERVTAEDAAPAWLVDLNGVEALQAAGLLDADGRLPERAWANWGGAANDRLERAREFGRMGGLAARHPRGMAEAPSSNPAGRLDASKQASKQANNAGARPNGAYRPVSDEQNAQAIARLEAGEFTTYGEALKAVRNET